jgi:hypothetical protein
MNAFLVENASSPAVIFNSHQLECVTRLVDVRQNNRSCVIISSNVSQGVIHCSAVSDMEVELQFQNAALMASMKMVSDTPNGFVVENVFPTHFFLWKSCFCNNCGCICD